MASRKGVQKPKGLLKDLPIADIVRLPELQCRAVSGLVDPNHAAELAEVVKDRKAKKLPRVQIRLVDGKGYLLTDGFDTVEAYRLAGRATVPANILRGTWHDALADAGKANVQHDRGGRPRSREDKRKAVRHMLEHFPDWSDRKIAEHVGVTHQTVGALRKPRESGDSEPEGMVNHPPQGDPGGGQSSTPVTWRDLPVTEFLEAADFVWAALKLAKVETAGQLFRAISQGARFGLKDTTVRDLLHAVEQLDGFDGRLSEAAERPRARQGAEQFNWRHFEGPFGATIRAVDAVAEQYPQAKDSQKHRTLIRLLREVKDVWDGWAEELTKKKEAA